MIPRKQKAIYPKITAVMLLCTTLLLGGCASDTKSRTETSDTSQTVETTTPEVISEDTTQTLPAEEKPAPDAQEETGVEAQTRTLTISVANMCGVDIGMFSVIDPVSEEQVNLNALADGELLSMEAEWPVEISNFQWAVYNQDGELYMEGTTDITEAKTSVLIMLKGDGDITDVKEQFE